MLTTLAIRTLRGNKVSKLKMVKYTLVVVAVLTGLSVLASCGAPPQEQPTKEEMSAAIMVVPNPQIGSRARIDVYGANFEPGETVKLGILIRRAEGTDPVETFIGPESKGAAFQCDDLGTFSVEGVRGPRGAGVYPVRVYDAEDNMIASTVLLVQIPQE